MANNEIQKSPPEGESYLREIRDAVAGIHDTLQKLQVSKTTQPESNKSGMHQHRVVDDVVISKDVLLEQLQIGKTTLVKWQNKKWIKCRYRTSRLVEYSYLDVMDALAENRLIARGFNPIIAYKRMLTWYNKNIGNLNQQGL
mgnify:CR=1 FL=1